LDNTDSSGAKFFENDAFTRKLITLCLFYFLELVLDTHTIDCESSRVSANGDHRLGRITPMGFFVAEANAFELADQRKSNQLVQLLSKLRWIGMDDEADRVLAQLIGYPFRPTETVIAGPWPTD
jgi:hypothetical protein